MDAVPDPEHPIITRVFRKIKAMDAGMQIGMEEMSHWEWKTFQILQPYYQQAKFNVKQE